MELPTSSPSSSTLLTATSTSSFKRSFLADLGGMTAVADGRFLIERTLHSASAALISVTIASASSPISSTPSTAIRRRSFILYKYFTSKSNQTRLSRSYRSALPLNFSNFLRLFVCDCLKVIGLIIEDNNDCRMICDDAIS